MLALLAGGCNSKSSERPTPPPAEVSVETLSASTVPVEYEFLGQTQASRSIEVRARVQGFLIKQAFKDGQWVTEGETLYEIDPRQFKADEDVAKARLTQAQARLEKAERDVARLTRLIEADAGQQKNLDDAKTEGLQAKAELATAQAMLANSVGPIAHFAAPLKREALIDGHDTGGVHGYAFDGPHGALLIVWAPGALNDGNAGPGGIVPLGESPVYLISTTLPGSDLAAAPTLVRLSTDSGANEDTPIWGLRIPASAKAYSIVGSPL